MDEMSNIEREILGVIENGMTIEENIASLILIAIIGLILCIIHAINSCE